MTFITSIDAGIISQKWWWGFHNSTYARNTCRPVGTFFLNADKLITWKRLFCLDKCFDCDDDDCDNDDCDDDKNDDKNDNDDYNSDDDDDFEIIRRRTLIQVLGLR